MMSSDPTPDFELFSSLRYDPQLLSSAANSAITGFSSPLYMLIYHRNRILEAAQHFQWTKVIAILSGLDGLQTFQHAIESAFNSNPEMPLRVRVAINRTGDFNTQSGPTPQKEMADLFPSILPSPAQSTVVEQSGAGTPSQAKPWVVLPDTVRTAKSSFSTYKTSRRELYDTARERAGIESFTEPKEVILINEEGEIMEGSLTSVILWRGGRWVTPPVSSGGQKGTTRRWLLEKGLVEEEVIKDSSLREGEAVWLSNGVRGLIYGKIKLRQAV